MRRPVKISRVPDSASARRPLGVHEAGGGGAAACRLADERRGFCFTGEMQPSDRSRLAFMIRYAMRHPGRIVPHARRLARDAVLRLRNPDHVSYYRAVMRSDAARSDEGSVGEVALGQVVRYRGTCRGPAGQFLGTRPEAHAGR